MKKQKTKSKRKMMKFIKENKDNNIAIIETDKYTAADKCMQCIKGKANREDIAVTTSLRGATLAPRKEHQKESV